MLVITGDVLDLLQSTVYSEHTLNLADTRVNFLYFFFMNQCMFLATTSCQDFLKYAK